LIKKGSLKNHKKRQDYIIKTI